jgi:hypothetical protein
MAKEFIVHCMDKSGKLIEAIEIKACTDNEAEIVFTSAHSQLYNHSHTVELLTKVRTLKNGDIHHEIEIKDRYHNHAKKPIERKYFKRRRDDS